MGGSVLDGLVGGSVLDGLVGGSVLDGLVGGSVLDGFVGGSVLDGLSAWNCREDEILPYIYVGKKSVCTVCFLRAEPIPSACTVEFI